MLQRLDRRRQIRQRCLDSLIQTPTSLIRSNLLNGLFFSVVAPGSNENLARGFFTAGQLEVETSPGIFRIFKRLASVMRFLSLSRKQAASLITVPTLGCNLLDFCKQTRDQIRSTATSFDPYLHPLNSPSDRPHNSDSDTDSDSDSGDGSN